jgi:hypothetical protein
MLDAPPEANLDTSPRPPAVDHPLDTPTRCGYYAFEVLEQLGVARLQYDPDSVTSPPSHHKWPHQPAPPRPSARLTAACDRNDTPTFAPTLGTQAGPHQVRCPRRLPRTSLPGVSQECPKHGVSVTVSAPISGVLSSAPAPAEGVLSPRSAPECTHRNSPDPLS